MKFYGDGLISLGIILISFAAILGIVFGGVHIALSRRLKKALKKEYGDERFDGGNA